MLQWMLVRMFSVLFSKFGLCVCMGAYVIVFCYLLRYRDLLYILCYVLYVIHCIGNVKKIIKKEVAALTR